jgi:6-pyruvoyltetrahydropterin/6-carboxytetrahydropterin synthase
MPSSIILRHNIEIAHRLMNLPGKCQQIHGHGMQVKLTISGVLNDQGILGGLDFHSVKKTFRSYLDDTWDHHLHLNALDPWADYLVFAKPQETLQGKPWEGGKLPGLRVWPQDPTTENIALWVYAEMWDNFNKNPLVYGLSIEVDETRVNGASFSHD